MTSRYQSALTKAYISALSGLFILVAVFSYHGLAKADSFPERLIFKAELTQWLHSREQYPYEPLMLSVKARNRLYQLYSSLLLNDVVSDYLYELVGGNAKYISEELVEAIVDSGLGYLSERDSERYLQVLKGYLVNAGVSECKNLIENGFVLSPKYVGSFNELTMREYSDVIRRAVLVEVTGASGGDGTVTSLSRERENSVKKFRYSQHELIKTAAYKPTDDSCQSARLLVDRSVKDARGNKVRMLRGYAKELH